MKKKYFFLFLLLLSVQFFLPRYLPADPFFFLASDGSDVVSYTEEEIIKYKEYYGLHKPLIEQYFSYIFGILRGDLGYSIYFKEKVMSLILKRFIWTFGIIVFSMGISFLVGIFLGSFSAWKWETKIDDILYQIMVILSEIPSFIIANIILMFFIIRWRVLPTAGGMTPFIEVSLSWNFLFDLIKHAVLPSLTLSLLRLPDFYFISRASMIQELQKKYVETAEAKSLTSYTIVWKHCFPNAINPMLTRFLLSMQMMFNASLIVENVFRYPGIGKLIRDAVYYRDYLLLQGIFFMITANILGLSILGEKYYQRMEKRREL
ncbi:MAG TPA: ABC transporter permease [Fusobacterium sp.]|uniref:ABC transporter permease n=1 Tax=Fusobacterium sp. TaxID=68766 RepID=UPI002F429299